MTFDTFFACSQITATRHYHLANLSHNLCHVRTRTRQLLPSFVILTRLTARIPSDGAAPAQTEATEQHRN